MLKMAPFRNMPASTAEFAADTVAAIKSGQNTIFVGSLTDQSGKVLLPAGQVMSDTILSGP